MNLKAFQTFFNIDKKTDQSPQSKRLFSVIVVLFTIAHLLACTILEQFTFLTVICIFLRFLNLSTLRISNLSYIVFWGYLELSFFTYICLSPLSKNFNVGTFSLDVAEYSLATFLFLEILYFKLFKNKSISVKPLPIFHFKFKTEIIALIIIPAFFTFISYHLDIIRMGVERPHLPFKLEHILNLTRSVIIPFFYIIFLGRSLRYQSRNKTKKFIIILATFNLWLLIETFLRGSKGFILITNFPVLLLLLTHNKLNLLKKIGVIFIIASPTIFIFGKAARYHNIHPQYTFTSQLKRISSNFNEQLLSIYRRNFYDAEIVHKFNPYIQDKSPSEIWSRFKEHEGTLQFHSRVIDKNANTEGHSSGTTLIGDGYFMIGELGIFLSLISLFILIKLNDLIIRPLTSNDTGVYAYSIFWIYGLTFWGEGFWSMFIYRSPLTSLLYPITCISFLLFSIIAIKLGQRNEQ